MSPTSESLERVLKPALYVQAGIPYFWLVATEWDIVVHAHERDGTGPTYVPCGTFIDVVTLDKLWRIEVSVDRLRRSDL